MLCFKVFSKFHVLFVRPKVHAFSAYCNLSAEWHSYRFVGDTGVLDSTYPFRKGGHQILARQGTFYISLLPTTDVNGHQFKTQYCFSKAYHMARSRGLPPTAGGIIWARQIERQVLIYETRRRRPQEGRGTMHRRSTTAIRILSIPQKI